MIMKQVALFLAMIISTIGCAQGLVEFPWNPDSDGDDFIGVNDLTALLAEYGTSFQEEELFVADDSTVASYFIGVLPYISCVQGCHDLPGRWKVPDWNEIGAIASGLFDTRTVGTGTQSWHWIETEVDVIDFDFAESQCMAFCNEQNANSAPFYANVLGW